MKKLIGLLVVMTLLGTGIFAACSGGGGIAGTVIDTTCAPVPGILVVVRTFGDQVAQATTRTDAMGRYMIKLPAGNYVVAAVNDTSTSMAASEWWTSSGGSSNVHSAEKVAVGSAFVMRNFTLTPGGRISGKVTAESNGITLEGIDIALINFRNDQPYVGISTVTDGTYNLNVTPGDYYLIARNYTLQPYASELFNSTSNGSTISVMAQKLSVTTGAAISADFCLLDGYKIEGTVSDPVTGPVAGMPVRIRVAPTSSFVTSLRTGADGGYRIWLRPGVYNMRARGQTAVVDATSANQTQSFNAAVGRVTAMLQDSHAKPVSRAKVYLYDSLRNMINQEVSNADGEVTVFSSSNATNDMLLIGIFNGVAIGSSIYLNETQFSAGTAVAVATSSTTTIGTISLPAGAVLTGTVTKNGQPIPNVNVNIRSGGLGGNNTFVGIRTMIDGSYSINLPANTTFNRVCAFDVNTNCPGTGSGSGSGPNYAFVDNVAMGTEGSTKTLDFAY